MAQPRAYLLNSALIVFWYTSNILVVLSNKYLLSNYGFRYPIFLTECHMVACAVMGALASSARLVPYQRIQSQAQLLKVFVLASIFCSSVVLGNVSLKYIPVSFNQAIGATTPLFTALITLCCLRQQESRWVYAALVPVVVGIVMATGGEPLFHAVGFACATTATCTRALKSVLQGVLLTDQSEKLDSMNLLLYMAPLASVVLIPALVIAEPDVLLIARQHALADRWFLLALALNASLAFFVNLSNFMVTKHTSALTLQVLGNAKGVVAAIISVLIFKNPVTLQGAAGYAIAVAGVVLYSQAKGRASQAQEISMEIGKQHRSLPPTPDAEAGTWGHSGGQLNPLALAASARTFALQRSPLKEVASLERVVKGQPSP